MAPLPQALRIPFRRLARSRGQAGVAVAAFALGLGLTGALFAVVQGTFLRGLPFDGGDRIVHVSRRPIAEGGVLPVELRAWIRAADRGAGREEETGVEALAGWIGTSSVWSGGDVPAERRNGAYASRDLFRLTGVSPALGRTFRREDALPGAAPSVVLSDALWRELYGSDPEIAGRTVTVGGEPRTVIGVLPPGFQFPLRQEYWIPLEPLLAATDEGVRLPVQAVARLREGVAPARAAAALDVVADRAALADGSDDAETAVTPFVRAYTEDARRSLWLATAAAVGVLLIACANVANLLLVRGLARSRELAVRTALGASRKRIAGQLLGEAGLLAAAGGAAGLGVAWAALRLYRSGGGLVRSFWVDVRLDPPTLGAVAGATLLAGLAAGVVPAWRTARLDPGRILGAGRGATGLRLGRLGRGLVVVQVGLSFALLVGTGLLVGSVQALYDHDFGAEPERVWTASVRSADAGVDRSAWPRLYDRLAERVEALPGVEAVSLTSHLPAGRTPAVAVEVEGEAPRAGSEGGAGRTPAPAPRARLAVVAPGFFRALGRPVLRGRDFRPRDREGAEPVAVVNRTFAEAVLGGSAVGRRIRVSSSGGSAGEWHRVVGVVPDLFLDWSYFEDRMAAGAPAGVYVPLAQNPLAGGNLIVRTDRPGAPIAPEVRAALAAVAPGASLLGPATLADAIADAAADHRRVRTLLASCAAVALALAALGLYGVLSFTVGERLRELGVRSALGARRRDLAALVVRFGASRLALGLATGGVLAAGAAGLLEGLLFGVEPWEPAAFLLAAAVLALAAATACLGPVRRAVRLDPARVLRED